MKSMYTCATLLLLLVSTTTVNAATYRCKYSSGLISEFAGVCPTGTINLGRLRNGTGFESSASSQRSQPLGYQLKGLFSDPSRPNVGDIYAQGIQQNAANQAARRANAAANAVQWKLNVIKEIDLLLQSGSISKDMADKLKAEALR